MHEKVSFDTESFKVRAAQVHFDFYSYDKVDYVSAKDKVLIQCPTHGPFLQSPSNHLHGYGCTKCGRDRTTKVQSGKLAYNTRKFIEVAAKTHEYKYDYSKTEYRGALAHVTITCPYHGDFQKIASEHIAPSVKAGCQKCGWDWRNT